MGGGGGGGGVTKIIKCKKTGERKESKTPKINIYILYTVYIYGEKDTASTF